MVVWEVEMAKVIDFNDTVAELVKQYPEIRDIMRDLGFKEITSPMALQLMGKVMTIPKGSAIKGIPMDKIIAAFEENGFTIKGIAGSNRSNVETANKSESLSDKRVELLKGYLKRLSAGEDLEAVKKDFITDFESVSVHEIMNAEQDLINEGEDPIKIRKLCDLHSGLFHGRTEGEVLDDEDRKLKSGLNNVEPGHPVDYLVQENSALRLLLNKTKLTVSNGTHPEKVLDELGQLKKIRKLYGKKEELIMPVLDRHGFTGPSEVMWGVDDEIKNEISRLYSELYNGTPLNELSENILAVIKRIDEMIYKEENILFPMALERFRDEEWVEIYRDTHEMGPIFTNMIPEWPHGDNVLSDKKASLNDKDEMNDGYIYFNGDAIHSPAGKLSIKELKNLLRVLPIDITFIDKDTTNSFYKNSDLIFSRPLSSLGRSTYDCHPAYIRDVVKQLIEDFKEGRKDTYEKWIPNPSRPVKITYAAIRDSQNQYIGTVEIVEDFTEAKKFLDTLK